MAFFFQHDRALVESRSIGDGTRVWAHAHILPGAVIGKDCNVCDGVFIENDVVVGDRVTVKCGVQLWDGVRLEDDVFVGPNATFTNDPFPRSKRRPSVFARTVVRRGASIGANATILCGIEIGENAMVGAGAVVRQNVPRNAVVAGNPATVLAYVDTASEGAVAVSADGTTGSVSQLPVKGVTLHELPRFQDLRGSLVVAELGKHLPFEPKRFFLVYDVPSEEIRGEHAHRRLRQLLMCVHGECSVLVDDGEKRAEVRLNRPTLALQIPPLVWAVQYRFSPDAFLLVAASAEYDADDYIRSYETFLHEVRG